MTAALTAEDTLLSIITQHPYDSYSLAYLERLRHQLHHLLARLYLLIIQLQEAAQTVLRGVKGVQISLGRSDT